MSNPSTSTTDSTDDPAVRLRSMLVAAHSLTLHIPGHEAHVAGRHTVTGDGRVRVELPADCQLAQRLAHQRETVAMIQVTDLAPTPVRNRVRGRGTLTGWLAPTGGDTSGYDGSDDLVAVLDLATAEVSTADGTTSIDPAAFATARPDPLAATEADLLCHLDHHHAYTVDRLCRLVPTHHMRGVRQVRPLRLDRHGVVLRLELPAGDRDVRLRFRSALRHPDELGGQIDALLSESRHCRRAR